MNDKNITCHKTRFDKKYSYDKKIIMDKKIKDLLNTLGFIPKDGCLDVYEKKYHQHQSYSIEIDFQNEKILYGELIRSENKTTQNFSQAENWVVLECVNRLLEKGYKPQNIILEKTWAAGHGTSGRLDICVTREDDSEYLLIECKTYGKEFHKAVAQMHKDGGQLFTYFKFSNKADLIMLYASELQQSKIVYKNEIVKIEDDYRTGDVKDFYNKWNKLTKDNGIFDAWVKPYCFESKALIKRQLKPITHADSSLIFNQFLEILRHNAVSDKGNAFNKVFTLFLCKVYDETTKQDDEELDFQWKEGIDNHVDFQLRLTDLYKAGMLKFLSRKVSDFDKNEFDNKYREIGEKLKKELLEEINRLRLEKNNEFAIKEVYDHDSFMENAKIVKEVVVLLQGYRLRYNKRQQYLSDFFEQLLTTGLKQESGQFFTPVPIAQFIIKSLPLDKLADEKLQSKNGELLPYMIDYASGSGHFITEYMHEVQSLLDKKDPQKYIEGTKKDLLYWQNANYEWATKHVYGIEKDYRLVKVGKVGCYLHGDGLANVILSDGLGNFATTKDYTGKLKKTVADNSKDNQQFDIILSNPPYSVSSFKQTTRDYYTENDFELYESLTDNSSEIECLFVERTKQLLKDGGVAGIILPSSILTNTGIYTKAREILLKYFEFIAITELGSNTFMATGTNTVVLFLRRRNNYACVNLEKDVEKFFTAHTDVTINNIEKPVEKYVNYVWNDLTFEDYLTLLERKPNNNVLQHDLYKEYLQKLKTKTDKEFWDKVLKTEKEKIYYFILAYPQRLVVVKTGEKDAEKQFLGYEFSNRRGSEGIHAIQRNKTIDECTKLFDINSFENPEKASTYIYQAFNGNFDSEISKAMQDNVSRVDLLDMMTFDRADFEKDINTRVKKKVKIESKWELKTLKELTFVEYGTRIVKKNSAGDDFPVYGGGGETFRTNTFNRSSCYVISRFGMSPECVRFIKGKFFLNDSGLTVKPQDRENLLQGYLDNYLYLNQEIVYSCGRGVAQKNIDMMEFYSIKIPLPPLEVQQKIVDEIGNFEILLVEYQQKITKNINKINEIINRSADTYEKLNNFIKLNEKTINPNRLEQEYFTYVDIDAVGNGKICFDKQVESQKAPSRARRVAYDRSILISTVRPYLKAFAYLEKEYNNTIYSTGFAIIRSNDESKLLGKYLYYLFMYHNKLMEQMKEAMPKGQYPSINDKDIRNFTIPVPPISEQQKIVAQIEELEKQIAEAQAAIDASKQQKQEILDKYLK